VHWLSYQWFNYWWPSDKGNGPEAIQQTLVYAATAALFVPIIHRWITKHLDALHAKLDKSHELMRHIIKYHPDIPEIEEQ